MTPNSTIFRALAGAAFVGLAVASLATPTIAGTNQQHLSCGSYKYCAKQGVIVRDHRTGATPSGK